MLLVFEASTAGTGRRVGISLWADLDAASASRAGSVITGSMRLLRRPRRFDAVAGSCFSDAAYRQLRRWMGAGFPAIVRG